MEGTGGIEQFAKYGVGWSRPDFAKYGITNARVYRACPGRCNISQYNTRRRGHDRADKEYADTPPPRLELHLTTEPLSNSCAYERSAALKGAAAPRPMQISMEAYAKRPMQRIARAMSRKTLRAILSSYFAARFFHSICLRGRRHDRRLSTKNRGRTTKAGITL